LEKLSNTERRSVIDILYYFLENNFADYSGNRILAIGVAAIFGIPLLGLFAEKGLSLPQVTESFGFALNDRLYPSYSLSLVSLCFYIVPEEGV